MERSFYGRVIVIVVMSMTGYIPYISSSQTTNSAVFRSPRFELKPGSVINRFYYDIDFPRGHIGVKSLSAEVVDGSGNSIPLTEAYVHHWTASAYRVTSHQGIMANGSSEGRNRCLTNYLGKSFGLGSETRRTRSRLPDPYAVETGKFDERWALSVHVIDTRGVADRLGCTECRCDLYNVTGEALIRRGYKGGLYCCEDQSQCWLSHKGSGDMRGLYLRYNVTWIDWSDSLLPVSVFVMDITDEYYSEPVIDGTRSHNCHVEYDIAQSCDASNTCVETRRNKMSVLKGGYLVYAVSHQHAGGQGTALYKEDGEIVCKSNPIYGSGKEAGNEAGYIVGMTACYPKPGSVKIREGDALVYESRYDSQRHHTGVMSLFYVVVADQLPNSTAAPMETLFV